MDPRPLPPDVAHYARDVLAELAPPAPHGGHHCRTCRDLIPRGYGRCVRCRYERTALPSLTPVALLPTDSQLHGLLRGYKDSSDLRERDCLTERLHALLWAFLDGHHACVAQAAGVASFDLVLAVPSATLLRERARPRLRGATASIFALAGDAAPVLVPSDRNVHRAPARCTDPSLYRVEDDVTGASVLLIDDTWVTGSRMRSAAEALKQAGATTIAGITLGRHITPTYRDNAARLARLPPATLDRCIHCAARADPHHDSSRRQASTSLR